jgi:DNA-binding CsgD family transcriptional regulator
LDFLIYGNFLIEINVVHLPQKCHRRIKKYLLLLMPHKTTYLPMNKEYELTPREHEILNKLKDGDMYKEIALHFEIHIDTVKKHCTNIYAKMNVRNRTEAINTHFGGKKS